MSITFTPNGGDVLMCEFGPDPSDPATYPLASGPVSVAPEMIKRRHVVVMAANHHMILVAPFSTVRPPKMRNFHMHIPADTYPFFAQGAENWLKADLTTAVSRDRLDRVFFQGRYQRAALSAGHLKISRACVLHGLGLGALGAHL
jgi:uncharacterized protein YifN (PemK superfamily)